MPRRAKQPDPWPPPPAMGEVDLVGDLHQIPPADYERRLDGGEWCARVKWAMVDGQLEPVAVELWRGAAPVGDEHGVQWTTLPGQRGPRALTASDLRSFRWGELFVTERQELQRQAREQLSRVEERRKWLAVLSALGVPTTGLDPWQPLEVSEWPLGPGFTAWQRAATEMIETRPPGAQPHRRGRRPLADDELAETARVYREATPGPTGRVARTAAVAKHFDIEWTTAVHRVRRARERGFLPPARPAESTKRKEHP